MSTATPEPEANVAAPPDSIQSLIGTGTRLWLDSVDPELVRTWAALGATGATSNPVIISDLIATGRFDSALRELARQGLSAEQTAWALANRLVSAAEEVFLPAFHASGGDDGYVSFELDPLIEDDGNGLDLAARTARYVELGQHWSAGHPNRMIKVPATPAGLAALGPLAAAGVPLNVTLVFSSRQYRAARQAIHDAAVRAGRQATCKSVYSIFVSRIDQYTAQHVPSLPAAAQGWTGILNARRIWAENRDFWSDRGFGLGQQIVFASTGTKDLRELPWKYVAALAGSDIQTNPPATNQAVAGSETRFERAVDQSPPADVVQAIDREVDFQQMEAVLMREGLEKFCSPQRKLLELIGAACRGNT